MYRLSGGLFLYPDEGRLRRLQAEAEALCRQSPSLAVFAFFGPWQRMLDALRMGAAEEIQNEYTRLFLINPEAPPYESFYLDPLGQAGGLAAAQLAREYAEAGLELSPFLKEPPDHAAVELEFMAFLCDGEAQAWTAGVPEEAMQILSRQRRFIAGHLGRWVPSFARRIIRPRPAGFYALVAGAAEAFVHHDADLIGLLLQRAPVPAAGAAQTGGVVTPG